MSLSFEINALLVQTMSLIVDNPKSPHTPISLVSEYSDLPPLCWHEKPKLKSSKRQPRREDSKYSCRVNYRKMTTDIRANEVLCKGNTDFTNGLIPISRWDCISKSSLTRIQHLQLPKKSSGCISPFIDTSSPTSVKKPVRKSFLGTSTCNELRLTLDGELVLR